MKALSALCLCLLASTALAFEVDDFFDRLDSALTDSAFHDQLRMRLSGTIDLEVYDFEQPAPGLIDSKIDNLFNPRLILFLDAQYGSQVYFFAQSLLVAVFYLGDRRAHIRLDEYVLPFMPRADARFTLQVGKCATVVVD